MGAVATPVIGILKKSLGWSIFLSVLMIVAGILAIVVPQVAGIAVTIFVGWLLIFGGVAHLVFGWHTRTTGGLLLEVLLGIVYILVGVYLLLNPIAGLVSLTLGLAIYFFAEGILEFILAFRLRPLPGSGWLFIDGIVTIILGVMILRAWPSSTSWAVGILVGVSMLFSGTARLMLSLAARRRVTHLASSAPRVLSSRLLGSCLPHTMPNKNSSCDQCFYHVVGDEVLGDRENLHRTNCHSAESGRLLPVT